MTCGAEKHGKGAMKHQNEHKIACASCAVCAFPPVYFSIVADVYKSSRSLNYVFVEVSTEHGEVIDGIFVLLEGLQLLK